jgi:hypothetical protein
MLCVLILGENELRLVVSTALKITKELCLHSAAHVLLLEKNQLRVVMLCHY